MKNKRYYVVISNDEEGIKILGVYNKLTDELINGIDSGDFIVVETNVNTLLEKEDACVLFK